MIFYSNSDSYLKRREKQRRKYIILGIIAVILTAAAGILCAEYAVFPISGEKINEPNTVVDLTVSPTPDVQQAASAAVSEETQPTQTQPVDAPAEESPKPAVQETDLLKTVKRSDGVKTAYLTFDDGPTKSITPQALDILRRYNVKATFFMVGSLIESNPDMARRVYEEGHLLANHSYSHNYGDLYCSKDNFVNEIIKTDECIKQITGEENYFKVFRYPGGSYNAGTWGANKQEYKSVLGEIGYTYCDWNALNGDAEGGKKTPEQLLQGVMETTENREDVVILMHDAATKQSTIDALANVIEYLMSQGYEFRRLDQ